MCRAFPPFVRPLPLCGVIWPGGVLVAGFIFGAGIAYLTYDQRGRKSEPLSVDLIEVARRQAAKFRDGARR